MVFEDKNQPGPSGGRAAGNIAPGAMDFQQPNNTLDSQPDCDMSGDENDPVSIHLSESDKDTSKLGSSAIL